MALGNRAPAPAGLVITPGPAGLPATPSTSPMVPAGPADYWEHRTLAVGDFTATGTLIDFPSEVELVAIESAAGDAIYCAFGPGASSAAGSYRFRAPGGGILVIPVPRIRQLSLFAGVSGVPVAPVEVYAFAGAPARLAR